MLQSNIEDNGHNNPHYDAYSPDQAHTDILLLNAGYLLIIETVVFTSQAYQHLWITGSHRLHDSIGGAAAGAAGHTQRIGTAIIGH